MYLDQQVSYSKQRDISWYRAFFSSSIIPRYRNVVWGLECPNSIWSCPMSRFVWSVGLDVYSLHPHVFLNECVPMFCRTPQASAASFRTLRSVSTLIAPPSLEGNKKHSMLGCLPAFRIYHLSADRHPEFKNIFLFFFVLLWYTVMLSVVSSISSMYLTVLSDHKTSDHLSFSNSFALRPVFTPIANAK